jgi:hypothetical protein
VARTSHRPGCARGRAPALDPHKHVVLTGAKAGIGSAWSAMANNRRFASAAIRGTKMSALFNLKMLGSAALALGILTVSLWPERASANIVFDFSGTCNIAGCPDLTSTASGVLTLTDAYVYGTNITGATFISFSYSSGDLSFDITSGDSPSLEGGLNSDGSFNAAEAILVESIAASTLFFAEPGRFTADDEGSGEPGGEAGNVFSFTNVTPAPGVPEASTWAMLLIGFAGLGCARYRASRKSAAVAARSAFLQARRQLSRAAVSRSRNPVYRRDGSAIRSARKIEGQTMTIRATYLATAAILALGAFAAPSAQAGYVVTLEEVGSNVVARGRGPIDLTGLTLAGSDEDEFPQMVPSASLIVTGKTGFVGIDAYAGTSGPLSFGSGSETIASSGRGDLVGISSASGDLAVPSGYVSGRPLADTSTYDGATFASLGVTPGVYKWAWGAGANQNFTLDIEAVPEPSTWAMTLIGFAGLGYAAVRKGAVRAISA